ncbi:3070_t:CDS:2, partial [Entrophospora sp. SA101]
LKAKQEEKDFNNLASVKEKIKTLCFIQQGYTGKVVIENFPDLTQLNLDFPVEELKAKNLRTISYSDNPLTAEEKTRLDALGLEDTIKRSRVDGDAQTWLDTKYPLDKRSEVEKLDLSNLGLQGELNLEGFTNLKSLDCSDNELTDLDLDELNVSSNKELQEVHANHNEIQETDFIGLSNLHTLMITSNELEEVDLSDLTSLKNCAENSLKELDISNCLKELDISNLKNL